MLASKFIQTELDAYIAKQNPPVLTEPVTLVNLIVRAFEAYEEYKRLVSSPTNSERVVPRFSNSYSDMQHVKNF